MNRLPTGIRSIRRCRVSGLVIGLLLVSVAAQAESTGYRDPEFGRIPFEKWLAEGKSQIHWNVSIRPPELSTHQRLILRVAIGMDGKELEKRRGAGEFLEMIQYRDAAGHVWQSHASIDLKNMKPGMQRQNVDATFYAFILPGDYTVSAAICDSNTLEHSVTVRRLHVDAPKTDPLSGAWAGLPAVEVISSLTEPPDVWFLPEITTGLNLHVATQKPVHIRVLLNTTPSQRVSGSVAAMRANMSLLIPALKILSRLDLPNGTVDAELLDLTHRRVIFEQKNIHELNWPDIRRYFIETRPGIIDAASLQGQWKMRKFFWDEVRRRLEPGRDGAVPVVIVLSGPAFLEDQEPVEPAIRGGETDRRLFYIRYRPPAAARSIGRSTLLRDTMMGRTGGRGRIPPMNQPEDDSLIPPMPVDDLEHTVEPLNARLFDAASARQFRRILAAVLEQISGM